MGGYSIHDAASEVRFSEHALDRLGYTHSHEIPRVGEAIDWHGKLWRVLDVVHPTEDQRGVGIYQPRVYVVAQDDASTPLDDPPRRKQEQGEVLLDADDRAGT